MELEAFCSLFSEYATRPQKSKQNSTSTKIDTQISRQDREPGNKPVHIWSIDLLQLRQECTMRKKILNVGTTGQLHVKE